MMLRMRWQLHYARRFGKNNFLDIKKISKKGLDKIIWQCYNSDNSSAILNCVFYSLMSDLGQIGRTTMFLDEENTEEVASEATPVESTEATTEETPATEEAAE